MNANDNHHHNGGHAANSTTDWHYLTMISMELRVLGAVLWTGDLLAVITVFAANRALLADALPRYSTLATACVFLTACTGAFNGWFELYRATGGAVRDGVRRRTRRSRP